MMGVGGLTWSFKEQTCCPKSGDHFQRKEWEPEFLAIVELYSSDLKMSPMRLSFFDDLFDNETKKLTGN